MPDNKLTESQTENLMEAITNAVLADQRDFDSIMRRYDVTPNDIRDYVALIESIHASLESHEPEEVFITNLRSDLFGNAPQSTLQRFPMRARFATVLAAILAAILWVVRRRGSDSNISDVFEEVTVH